MFNKFKFNLKNFVVQVLIGNYQNEFMMYIQLLKNPDMISQVQATIVQAINFITSKLKMYVSKDKINRV